MNTPMYVILGLVGLVGLLTVVIGLGTFVVVLLPGSRVPIRYSIRNLLIRWRTTLLTVSGAFLVVAILVVTMSFVEGLRALAGKAGQEGNIIVLREGATDELFSDLSYELDFQKILSQPEVVKDESGEAIHSKEIYNVVTQEVAPATQGGRARYRFLQVRGIENAVRAGRVHGLTLREGRWFGETGQEIVMGEGIAGTLGMRVGSDFEIQPGLKWKVTGIMATRGSPFDSEIWAKLEEVGLSFGKFRPDDPQKGQKGLRNISSLVVRTKDRDTAEAFAKVVKERTALEVSALTEEKYYENMSQGTFLFLGAAVFVAAVMGIGGLFGLMTTMYAGVAQRSKDIGVLRILGFSRFRVLACFLFESLLVALVGGLMGLLAGSFVHGAQQVGVISSGQGGGKTVVFEMLVTPLVFGMAGLFILVMGVWGGLLPAYTATRLRPLEAMR